MVAFVPHDKLSMRGGCADIDSILFICVDMYINASRVGSRTICIRKQACQSFCRSSRIMFVSPCIVKQTITKR